MGNRDKWRLCGGTFFTLISSARKPLLSKDENYKGNRSGLSEPETLLALARIVTPDIPKPMKTEEKTLRDGTLDFKSCVGWGSRFFRLGDKSAKKSFDDRIKNDYTDCLASMAAFTNRYLELHTSTRKDEYLVKALIEVLEADKEIDNDAEFYAKEDGSIITKEDILKAKKINFEALLLGIWHYVLLSLKDNKIGAETYEEWCPLPDEGTERPYTAEIGENSTRKVTIDYCDPMDAIEDEPDDEVFVDEEETTDTGAEQIDSDNQTGPVVQQIYNDHPTFFNFNVSGNNNKFYGHVDRIDDDD
ncbi:hypothetical protein [Oribacterium sp. FC2011]|uniref:hypothetical protein n=1 Tax=Oribacterium sp. FC2011 TaxID=1408311 RepID=UPI0004E131D6|nr:hypothetical protein [Oribacterium sp. FC2011]